MPSTKHFLPPSGKNGDLSSVHDKYRELFINHLKINIREIISLAASQSSNVMNIPKRLSAFVPL